MVSLKNVKRRLGPGVAFHCPAFHADAGARVALWGPSGCGKSTLLNLISGLLRPHEGEIVVDGVDIAKLSEAELDGFRGERFGFIFQTFNLLAPFTALQNVMIGMRFADVVPAREWRERAEATLKRVGLGHRLHARPATLSVGERQRVAIARALANDPVVLLADEPTGNLDSRAGAEILDLFRHLHEARGMTMVVITHSHEVARRAQRVLCIRDGRIVAEQRPN